MRATVASWLLLLAAACGRLDFDEVPGGSVVNDAGPDAGSTSIAFRDLCAFDRLTVIENGLAVDDQVGAGLAAAVAVGCAKTPTTRTVDQDDPGILDPSTDRPLIAPDDLVILGGGDGPHRALAYLLDADTPVIWSGGSTATYTNRATGELIVMGPTSSSHDYALLMIVTEPIGGGRILSASGMQANGTKAAGYWFANVLAPAIATDADVWTLVEWTDSDGAAGPTAGDTFTVLASG